MLICCTSHSQPRTGTPAARKRMEAYHHARLRSAAPRNRARMRRPESQPQAAFLPVRLIILNAFDKQIPYLSYYTVSRQHADPRSHVDISVWHKSQTKKKTRRRNQVASARITLGDVLKRQAQDSSAYSFILSSYLPIAAPTLTISGLHRAEAEIRLSILASAGKRSQSCRGKQQQQPSACLFVRLRTPASFASQSDTSTLLDCDDVRSDVDTESDGRSCECTGFFKCISSKARC